MQIISSNFIIKTYPSIQTCNELMRNHFSDSNIPQFHQLKIDTQRLQSIPPGCQKQSISGMFTLRIETNYLNSLRQANFLRCKLWGMQEGIILQELSSNERIINLNIRSNIENITKYFQDMKAICIQVLIGLKKDQVGSLQKKKIQSDFKQIGWIFVNPQRYVINHIINDFEETVSIIDLKKQKIGEAKAKIYIKMYKQQELFIHPSEPLIIQPTSLKEIPFPALAQNKDLYQNILPVKDPSLFSEHKSSWKELLRENKKDLANSQAESLERQKMEENDFLPQFKKKSRAQEFLQEYNKNKPLQSQLSLLRDKFGFNHPSVEVMKLKYDEVKLLSQFRNVENKKEQKINILLKTLKNQTKNKIEYLSINCEDRSSKIKVQTKIVLPDPLNQKIEINYLYMIPNCSTDLLTFQIKDGKAEMQAKNVAKIEKIELKNKIGKKVAILELVSLSNEHIQQNNIKNQIQNSRNEKINPISPQTQAQVHQSKQQKESGYICVLNWPENKISLKNKHFGITSARKLLFELNDPTQNVIQVILQNDKKEVNYLEVQLTNLFQEQNYLIEGHQVKVISCRGNVFEILSLIEKLEHENLQSQQKTQEQNKIQENDGLMERLKNCVAIFEKFSMSQEVECKELIQQMAMLNKINSVQIQQISKILEINPKTFLFILNEQFNSNFSDFLQMFQIYHLWNHKYTLSLRKLHRLIEPLGRDFFRVIKKLKKSNDVLFGAISSHILINYFSKMDQGEGEFDHESLGRLFALHFQRYFHKSIKISEIELFIQEKSEEFNLNFYLLCKMSFQIKNDPETFKQLLNEEEIKFIQIFKIQKDFAGEPGLAKLLLTSEQDDLTESSVLSQLQHHNRKQTERAEPVITEQSRQPLQQEHEKRIVSKESENYEGNLSKQKEERKIPVVLSSIQLQKLQSLETVTIFNETENISLTKEQLIFPKAILLLQDEIYTMTVKTAQSSYEGVFVATKKKQKKKLYNNNSEACGFFCFFEEGKTQTEQSEIPFQLVTTHKTFQIEQFIQNRQQYENDSSLLNKNFSKTKSPQVRLIVRSISPTRPKFQFKIISRDSEKFHFLEYPNQNQLLVPNSSEGWTVRLLNQDFEEILVPNTIGSSPYYFINGSDKQVGYMINIEVAENWNNDFGKSPKESLHIFCHFEEIICLSVLKPSTYSLIIQKDQNIKDLGEIEVCQLKRLKIGTSVQLDSIGDRYEVKIINKQTKELQAEFEFTVKLIQEKVQKSERYLISKHDGFRLKVTVFQMRHEWTHYKSDKFLPLFNSTINKQTLQSYLSSTTIANQQMLITWIRNNFELTLGQIDILLNQLIDNKKRESWKYFVQLFTKQKHVNLEKDKDIQEEFKTFDLNEQGKVSYEQMTFIKRTLQKNYKQTYQHFTQLEYLFKTSPEIQKNFIIDLSVASQNCFDYLSFFAEISDNFEEKPKQKKPSFEEEKIINSNYLKIGILSFSKLSINGAPSTFLFKINGKRLADPVHRCFSYNYTNPVFIEVENEKKMQLQIFCQRLNLEGQWEYKLIEKVLLSEQIKILGGVIKLKIDQIDEKREVKFREQESKDINFSTSQIKQKKKEGEQLRENENRMQRSDFQRSFWNKSLNETRQKWAKSNMGGTGTKQKRKLLNLKSQEILKKMNIFDQLYEK